MKIAYDATRKKPGCVIIQAVMGGDPNLIRRFRDDSWLTEVTPDMKVYEVTPEQADYLVKVSR